MMQYFREEMRIYLEYKEKRYKYIGTKSYSIISNLNSEKFKKFFNKFFQENNINLDTFYIDVVCIDDLKDEYFNVDEIPLTYRQFFKWHVNTCDVFDYLKDDESRENDFGTLHLYLESYVMLFFSIQENTF